jgi:hypothetical protein
MMIRWDLGRVRMNIIPYYIMLLSFATIINKMGILASKYDVRVTTFRELEQGPQHVDCRMK